MVSPSPNVEDIIRKWYEDIESGDFVGAADRMLTASPHFIAIDTEPGNWIAGREALIQAYAQAAKLGRSHISVLRIHAYTEGDVAGPPTLSL